MRALRLGMCLASLALCPAISLAQRAVPANANGTPKAPPGMAQPLAAGPFTYRTGEGQDIRVTVLTRLAWPYGIAFLPNGDMLVTQRTGELRRMPKGTTELQVVPGGPQAITPITSGVHGYMSMAVHPQLRPEQFCLHRLHEAPCRKTNAPLRLHAPAMSTENCWTLTDIWVGDNISAGPAAVAMTPDGKLWVALAGGNGKIAQDPTSLAGKVLRLNDDGTVPKDNPFVGKEGYRAGDLHASVTARRWVLP